MFEIIIIKFYTFFSLYKLFILNLRVDDGNLKCKIFLEI
jgi:hypothetical protein